jgi:hypothetical protein
VGARRQLAAAVIRPSLPGPGSTRPLHRGQSPRVDPGVEDHGLPRHDDHHRPPLPPCRGPPPLHEDARPSPREPRRVVDPAVARHRSGRTPLPAPGRPLRGAPAGRVLGRRILRGRADDAALGQGALAPGRLGPPATSHRPIMTSFEHQFECRLLRTGDAGCPASAIAPSVCGSAVSGPPAATEPVAAGRPGCEASGTVVPCRDPRDAPPAPPGVVMGPDLPLDARPKRSAALRLRRRLLMRGHLLVR